uniref:Rho-GAP domain-containing protein n=1 Tax=Heterorhabditis bacteriophora TaxID=37862 RepID=A0A1I7XHJ4_HETBA
MHRYKAKSSQLQSPVAGKRAINDGHYAQPGTSKDSSSGENGEPSTPKSGRKWKKSKAGKQGSGGSVSGQQPTATQPQSVLGIKLADCIMAGPDEYVPLLVQICVGVVEAHGLDTVGIYRIPGNTAAVNALKETLSHGFDTVTPENVR